MWEQLSMFDDADRDDSEHPTPMVVALHEQATDVNSTGSEHPTPIARPSRKLIVGDWERGIGWVIYDGQNMTTMSKGDFAAGRVFCENPGCSFVVESAHFQETTGYSKAQPYGRDELETIFQIAEENNVDMYFFPQKLSPRARRETGYGSKADDVKAIYHFVIAHPEIGLMKARLPEAKEQKLWDARRAIRDNMTDRLNVTRFNGYKKDPETAQASRLLLKMWYGGLLTGETIKWFKLKLNRHGTKVSFNECSVMAVYVAVFDEHGNLRVNDKGNFIGVRGARDLIQLSPYHFKSGTARSNLMWHRLRNELKEKNGDVTIINPEGRREFAHAVTDLIQAFRDSHSVNCSL